MKVLKFVGFVIALLIFLVICAMSYVKLGLPDIDKPEDLTVPITPELVARGEYLANTVTVCMDCHSTRDWSRFSGPLVDNTLGKGGEVFDHKFGFPGVFTSKNITSSGIGDWSDAELYRAITSGVTKSGTAIFPVMPYRAYGKMAKEDIYAIIAYIRSLKPIDNTVGNSTPDFPMNFIINTIPQPADHQPLPDKSDVIAYGAYMTNAAGCTECHTPQENGAPIMSKYMAGGFPFQLPGFGVVISANITPDQSGIGSWSEDQFVERFKYYGKEGYVAHKVNEREFQSVMPWTMYARMEEEDLRAIYQYLQTIEPVEHVMQRFTPEESSGS